MTLSLKNITLYNFRGIHGNLSWEFHKQPGFYFIQGQNLKEPSLGANGAGKSTIFVDAPYWVLTGKTTMSQRPGNSIEPWGVNKTTVYGELTLVIGDQEYIIRRGRNPSVLVINNRAVEQADIDKLIPLSDSALRHTLLLGQRSSMFLDLRPEEKSRLFSETLDLDIWLRAADLAGERLKTRERESAKIVGNLERVSGSMNEIRDQHETATNKENQFAAEQELRLAELHRDLKIEVQKHDALNGAFSEAQTRLKEFAQTSTTEDELRIQRSRERALRDAVILNELQLTQTTQESDRLYQRIQSYEKAICPECGQSLPDDHHTKPEDLMVKYNEYLLTLNKLPKTLNELKAKIADNEQTTIKMEQTAKEFIELRTKVLQLAEQSTSQERLVIRMTNDAKRVESEENPYSKLCDELEARYKKLDGEREILIQQEEAINTDIEVLKFWQKGYRDIRLEQIDSTLLELEIATNRNAAALGLQDWEIQFATERETKSGNVSHAFSIFLFPPGQNKPVSWDSYSGGEAQRWQLAVTFGLSEVLLTRAGINPDIEILDEPTGFLSQEGIDDLLECLHSRAHDLQRRIYLIDHRSLERGSFDGIVTVVKDNSGIRIDDNAQHTS